MVNQTLSKYIVRQEDVSVGDSGNFNTCELVFYRQFNMVICYYHFWTKAWNDGTPVDHEALPSDILPVAFRPNEPFYQTVVNYSGTVKHGLLTISNDGSILFRLGTNNLDMSCYGSVSYFVEEETNE